jgi:hypothetical protein
MSGRGGRTTVAERASGSAGTGERRLERAIVLALVDDETDLRWSCAQLAAELGVEAEPLARALERLSRLGVVRITDGDVSVSPATRRIDELGLLGI